ncbi:MAG: DUF1653 domain-containing protein [Lachnospiraceae bacterium]|nr:DUF1653 domain-containing protein [Lachnospiraceae bacterium]MCI9013202.1 DUF1653 domain-containing protein [Lachnospiraceae bacterium]
MRPNPRPQEMYRHFKGNIYQIRCLAKHSETGEMMVVYQAMYDTFQIYVRPLAMFMEEVDVEKYPDARQQYRFELLQDSELVFGSQAAEETISRLQAVEETISGLQAVEEPVKESNEGSGGTENAEEMQQLNIDPLVMEFLEADTYEQRLNILAALRSRITDEMINTMAMAVDLEIKEGDVEERYEELRNCLLTFEKYECNRLR